ncbi:MAG: PQQ-like beta-propeller repeat protein [Acidobacteriota bacterium]|nr:PQQ-like beta-propeller repeat protein [Acidobacteriota bacterium]
MNTSTAVVRKPLRLWPGVAAFVLFVVARFAVPAVFPDAELVGLLASVIASVIILVWWLFFSRLPWAERLGGLALLVVAIAVVHPFLDPSIAGAGMGNLYYIFSVQLATLALVLAVAAARGLSAGPRRIVIAAAIVLACAFWTLIRTDGVTSTNLSGGLYHWRWTPTAEQRLLAQAPNDLAAVAPVAAPTASAPAATPVDAEAAVPEAPATDASSEPAVPTAAAPVVAERAAEWPGFRGASRDGVVRGVRIATDWTTTPPVALWRRPIGPGWSSFSVRGDRLYTQEQRGEEEIVACYKVSTGEPVWMHRDANRFYESNGGAGPRATPTLSGGRVFSFGATGVLNALDAGTGVRAWSRNVATDVKRVIPGWGFTSSPIVVDDVVIVAASGTLAAYEAATGNPKWVGPRQLGSYSSPHLATIDGVKQVILLSGSGAAGISPVDGTLLWESKYEAGTPIVQPAVTADGDVLVNAITMTGGSGITRISLTQGDSGWAVTERWTSNGLKPYFNDFVVHKGHAYGFDGNILSSINLEDGKRNWKGGRYGNGQMVLLADQDLLLVISEDGELVLVNATTDKFTEVARVPALDGKTWNHPVVIGDLLLVRNGAEMAAFRLPAAR